MNYKYDLPNGWRVADAQEYCVKVADGTHDSPKQTEVGKLLVTSKNIVGGRLDLYSAYHISLEDFEEVNRRSKVDRYDVLLSMIGTVGQACLIEEDPDFAIKNVALLKNTDPYKAKWLYFYLTSTQAQFQIKERLRGTTQQYLPLGEIRKFPVPYPENEYELRRVVDILSSLHDKIELNHQINQTLEQVAQAIFKSWFVDFDPVKAKIEAKDNSQDPERAAMCAISGKSEEELDQFPIDEFDQIKATAKLFPDELVESELGEIPRGWVVSTIGNEVSIYGGGTPSTSNPEFWEGGEFLWATPKDLSGLQDKVLLDTERKITQPGVDKISSGQLPVGTVLMSSRAPVGYLAISTMPISINQGFIAMVCDKKLPSVYVIQWVETNMDAIKSRASGSTFAEINKATFRPILVIVPDKRVLDSYSSIVINIYGKIETGSRESKSLAETRDTLLPKLLSGAFMIGTAELTAEAIA